MTSRNTNNSNLNTLTDFFSLLASDLAPELKSLYPSSASSQHFSDSNIRVDLDETPEKITVLAELPGVNKTDISIDFYNNQLVIKANKIKPQGTFTTNEIKYGAFERKLTLPICITVKETVSTSYENGILKIVINKLIEEANRFSLRVN